MQQIHIAAQTAKDLGLPIPEGSGFLILYDVRAARPPSAAGPSDEEDEDDFDVAQLPRGLRAAIERYSEDRQALLGQLREQETITEEVQRELRHIRRDLAAGQARVEKAAGVEAELRQQLVTAQLAPEQLPPAAAAPVATPPQRSAGKRA